MNSRDFTAPYVFHEYPKWVTLADGSQMLAESADEEEILVGASADEDADREALMAKAKSLGLNPHHRAGVEKLQSMIAEAQA
jgi:hypothetical protein